MSSTTTPGSAAFRPGATAVFPEPGAPVRTDNLPRFTRTMIAGVRRHNIRICREWGGREDRSCLIMRVRPTRVQTPARVFGRGISDGQVVTTGPALRGACISEER
jgi:hypothetical protein